MKSLFVSLWTKTCQILHVILESINKSKTFPSSFVSIFSAIKHNSFVLSLAEILYALVKSSPLKCKFLKFLSARVEICQIPHVNFELTSHFPSNFVSFFIVMTNTFPVSLKLIHFLLWMKGPNKCSNYETFLCSGGNLQNFWCHFPNPSQFLLKFCITF